MSSSESPELEALNELEDVIRHVSDELAAWRRRALKAEGERPGPGGESEAARERLRALEAENEELKQRLEAARARLRDLLKRLSFLEEQVAMEEPTR